MMDAGHIAIYEVTNSAVNGGMPKESLELVTEFDFEEMQVGVTRYYAALGVNQLIDLYIRSWREPLVKIGMIGVVTDSDYDGQYRIDNVTNTHYSDSQYRIRTATKGLKTTDITMSKLEKNYDIDEE